MRKPGPLQLYSRLSQYLHYLKSLPPDDTVNISSTILAEALGLHDVQVRKDLAAASRGGRPKVGYVVEELIASITHFLGQDHRSDAALVGVGNLGKALISYANLNTYGLHIAVAFDHDPHLIGHSLNGVTIHDARNIPDICRQRHIQIGIITVPGECAQGVCDTLTAGGIRAIWNFAPVSLKAEKKVVVKNEDMAASLAILFRQLADSVAQFGAE